MANNIANSQPRDTNTDIFPMEHPVEDEAGVIYQYVNNLDSEVTISVHASYDGDDDWSDEYQIGSDTIAADGRSSQSLSDPWDKIRFKVTASTTPTTGNVVIKEHELE